MRTFLSLLRRLFPAPSPKRLERGVYQSRHTTATPMPAPKRLDDETRHIGPAIDEATAIFNQVLDDLGEATTVVDPGQYRANLLASGELYPPRPAVPREVTRRGYGTAEVPGNDDPSRWPNNAGRHHRELP